MLAQLGIKGYIKVICEIYGLKTIFNYSIDLKNYLTFSTIKTKA